MKTSHRRTRRGTRRGTRRSKGSLRRAYKRTRKVRGGGNCTSGSAQYHDTMYNKCKDIYEKWPYGSERSKKWQNGWYLYDSNGKNNNNHIHLLPDGRVLLTYEDEDDTKQHDEIYCVDEDGSTYDQIQEILEYSNYDVEDKNNQQMNENYNY